MSDPGARPVRGMIPSSAAAYTVDYGVKAAMVTASPMTMAPSFRRRISSGLAAGVAKG